MSETNLEQLREVTPAGRFTPQSTIPEHIHGGESGGGGLGSLLGGD